MIDLVLYLIIAKHNRGGSFSNATVILHEKYHHLLLKVVASDRKCFTNMRVVGIKKRKKRKWKKLKGGK